MPDDKPSINFSNREIIFGSFFFPLFALIIYLRKFLKEEDDSRYFEKIIVDKFYIPENNDLRDLGTSLYETKDIDFIKNNDTKGHYPLEHFNLVKKIEFLPNTLFVFPRTNFSFHGVDTINVDNAERHLLLLNYYFKDTESK